MRASCVLPKPEPRGSDQAQDCVCQQWLLSGNRKWLRNSWEGVVNGLTGFGLAKNKTAL